MKTLKIILLFAAMIVAGRVWAKNNTIQFDELFNVIGDASVEPHEIVTLSGTYDPLNILSFKIFVDDALADKEVKVNFMKSNWTAQVGPFLPNQSVSLKFMINSKLSESEKNKLVKDFDAAYDTSMNWIINNLPNNPTINSSNGLYSAFIQKFKKYLPLDFQLYKNDNGQSALEILIDSLGMNKQKNIINYYDSWSNLERSKSFVESNKGFFSNSAKKEMKGKVDSLLECFENNNKTVTDTLVKHNVRLLLSSVKSKEFDFNWDELITSYNHKKKYEDEIEAVHKKLLNKLDEGNIIRTSELTRSLENSTKLSIDLQQFIGFDIVPMAFFFKTRPSSPLGIFFTVSPYFGKINPNSKIRYLAPNPDNEQNGDRKTRRAKNFVRCVTPTIGIALTTVSDSLRPKPIVFGGIGIRINPVVRVNAGVSVYVPNGESTPMACFTCGIGINVNYVGEVLKIFSTASANF
jgi:hypothetical protein